MGMARGGDATGAQGEITKLQSLREELVRLKDDYWAEQVEIQRQAALAWVAKSTLCMYAGRLVWMRAQEWTRSPMCRWG